MTDELAKLQRGLKLPNIPKNSLSKYRLTSRCKGIFLLLGAPGAQLWKQFLPMRHYNNCGYRTRIWHKNYVEKIVG